MGTKPITCGPEGDTLFSKPFLSLLPNELPDLFRKVENLHDDRLLALVTALIVEGRVDRLLAVFCPRYERLSEQNEFTFSLKIRMLEALSLIPQSITDACHIVRAIRNDFAHNLERTNLSATERKLIVKMEALLRRVKADWANSSSSNDGPLKNFKNLSFLAIVGVDVYFVNLAKLRDKISTSSFIAELENEAHQECLRNMQESRERGAKGAIKHGTRWEIVYDSFTEFVDNLPPGVQESVIRL